jgi:hypothetical protein
MLAPDAILVEGLRRAQSSSSLFFSPIRSLVFVLLVPFRVAEFAGFPVLASDAIFRGVAAELFRAELIAAGGVGYGFHWIAWDVDGVTLHILRGDLDAIEKEAGAAGVELGRTQRVQDLGQGVLDGTAVFEDRKLQNPVRG